MKRTRSWGVLNTSTRSIRGRAWSQRFEEPNSRCGLTRECSVAPALSPGHLLFGCLLSVAVACGGSTSNDTERGSTGGTSSDDTGGTSSDDTGGTSSGDTGGTSDNTGGSSAQPEACDCDTRDCRPAPEVASELCSNVSEQDLVTYTEREGCDYVQLTYDYNRGWREYYYDKEGTLVAFKLDNAFGGSVDCGVETSCSGSVVRACRICRGGGFDDDDIPDCPATVWETGLP